MTDIVISIDDWINEYKEKEPNISDEDALIEARKTFTTAELARMVLAARLLKVIPDDIIDSDKVCLWSGAQLDISRQVTRRKTTIRAGNEDIEVREYVAYQPNGDEHENEHKDVIVDVRSEQAVRYATRYLMKTVTGHIHNRLAIIAVNDGNVQEIAEALINTIREIAEKLTGPAVKPKWDM